MLRGKKTAGAEPATLTSALAAPKGEDAPPKQLVGMSTGDWYREMFWNAPIAMLEEDWRGAKRAVDELLRRGITDLDRYVAEHPEFISQVRTTHRVVDANAAALRLFGFESKAEFLRSSRELLPANVESNMQVYRAFAAGVSVAQGERVLRGRGGSVTPILWRAAIPSQQGEFGRMVFYAVDVSALKRAEQALMAAHADLAYASRSSMLGEMVASIAHEINQPLGAIKLYIDTARRWLDRPEPDVSRARRSVNRAHAEADRASNIVVRVKNLVRRVRSDTGRVPIGSVIAGAIALVEQDARLHRVHIESARVGKEIAVRGEETQIQQALVNLLNNAIQSIASAQQQDGRVQVAVHAEGEDMVEIEVLDNGPGLPPGPEEQIFRPFFTTKPDGMGLGLSICRTMIESQGGRISARRLDAGGTIVAFALPIFR